MTTPPWKPSSLLSLTVEQTHPTCKIGRKYWLKCMSGGGHFIWCVDITPCTRFVWEDRGSTREDLRGAGLRWE